MLVTCSNVFSNVSCFLGLKWTLQRFLPDLVLDGRKKRCVNWTGTFRFGEIGSGERDLARRSVSPKSLYFYLQLKQRSQGCKKSPESLCK